MTILGSASARPNAAAPTYSLGATSIVVGPASGSTSVVLGVSPSYASWTASVNSAWLHLPQTNGTGSTNMIFSFDSNPGGTRIGLLDIAGLTLTITQAGSNYVQATGPATALVPSGLSNPEGVAVDAAGNVYIADANNNALKEWNVASNTVITLISNGLDFPEGVAVDASNNVYLTDNGNNALKEWLAASKTVITLVSKGLTNPFGVALDKADNIYIANAGQNNVKEWLPSSGTLITLISNGLNNPQGLALDAIGNVYIADHGSSTIKEWFPSSGILITLVSAGTGPEGVAVDGMGNVYFAATANQEVQEWSAVTGAITLVASNLSSPSGVAVDGTGNVYFANFGNGIVMEQPLAFVDTTPVSITSSAIIVVSPPVLPVTANLRGPFAPTFNVPWAFTIGEKAGITTSAFNGNPTASPRVAYMKELAISKPITQNPNLVYGGTNFNGTNFVPLASGTIVASVGAAVATLTSTLNGVTLTPVYGTSQDFGFALQPPVGTNLGTGAVTNSLTNFGVEWEPLDPTGSIPQGAYLQIETIGSAAEIVNGTLAEITVTKLPSSSQVTADFLNRQITGLIVNLFDGTNLIATTTMPNNGPICYLWPSPSEESVNMLQIRDFELYYGWYAEPAWTPRPVSFSPSGPQYNCNGAVITPQGVTTANSNVTQINFLVSGSSPIQIPSITVTNVAVAPLWLNWMFANSDILNFTWFGTGVLQYTPDLYVPDMQPWQDLSNGNDASINFFYRVRQPVGYLPGFVGTMPPF